MQGHINLEIHNCSESKLTYSLSAHITFLYGALTVCRACSLIKLLRRLLNRDAMEASVHIYAYVTQSCELITYISRWYVSRGVSFVCTIAACSWCFSPCVSTPNTALRDRAVGGCYLRKQNRNQEIQNTILEFLLGTSPLLIIIFFENSDFLPFSLQDLGTFVEQLARFLGVSCDKAQLEGMVESCNQLIEQCSNSEALSVCRGEWEKELHSGCKSRHRHAGKD